MRLKPKLNPACRVQRQEKEKTATSTHAPISTYPLPLLRQLRMASSVARGENYENAASECLGEAFFKYTRPARQMRDPENSYLSSFDSPAPGISQTFCAQFLTTECSYAQI